MQVPDIRDVGRVAKASPPASDADLRIGVLGGMTAVCAGLPVELGGPRQRAVLGLLVVARGEVVPADRLVEEIWGGEQPPSATGALQAYVSHLRRRLEPARDARDRHSVIPRLGGGYALRVPDDAVDAWVFERLLREAGAAPGPDQAEAALDRALALWRGPPYADHLGQAWADAEGARLSGLRDVAREQLLAVRLQRGESAVLVPEIEALVAEDPLREERWRLLVLALYRAHRQADALAALRKARQTLADELGVDPGPALRALEAAVLAQSPDLDSPAVSAQGAAASGAPAPGTPATPPQPRRAQQAAPPVNDRAGPAAGTLPTDGLMDRERELGLLTATLRSVVEDGEGGLALIEGPAGIGKTRLLAELRRLGAQGGALVLTARGSQLEKEYGFGVVRQLFESVVADPRRRDRVLAGPAEAALGVFEETGTSPDGTFAVLHGIYWLAVNISADRPLVLAVDDLQWCDTGSLRALAFLVRRLEGLPVALAATLRTGEPWADEALIADLAQDPATTHVRPAPLSREAVGQLVRDRLGRDAHESFVTACHRTTGGNPLLLRQLLRGLESEGVRPDASHADTVNAIGSRAVSSMVLMRLSRLPGDCTRVARSVAVLGDGADLPGIAEHSGLDETATAAAVGALVRAEVLADRQPLGFVHPLVEEAVYRDLPAGERELQHQRAVHILRGAGAPPEQIAAHLLQVPRRGDPAAVEVLRAAAARAAARGAAEGAIRYLERALAEPADESLRPHLLLEIGRLATLVDGPAAVTHLRGAWDSLTEPRQRAEVALMLARTLIFAGRPGEPVEFARQAAAQLPAELADERQGLLALERIGGYMHGLDPALWRRGEVTVEGEGVGARMLAAEQAWEILIDGVKAEQAIALGSFAIEESGGLTDADPGLFWVIAGFVQEMSDIDVSAFYEAVLARAHTTGSLFASLSVHLWRGHMLWHRGKLAEARDEVHRSNLQSEMWGAPEVGVPYGRAFLVGIMLDQGDVAAARAYVDERPDLQPRGDGARLMLEAEGKLLVAEGRYGEALTLFDEAARAYSFVQNPLWRPWRSLRASALAGLGRQDEAVDLLRAEFDAARAWGTPSLVGRSARLLAEQLPPGTEATALLEEAVGLLRTTAAALELARAQRALGRTRGGTDGEQLLREALALALACGSASTYQEVAVDLAARGVTVPLDAVDSRTVTSTERRMVERAGRGHPYRDVAHELMLTPHAVERALHELRERFGVTSDEELLAALPR